jgi:hypothetical protein
MCVGEQQWCTIAVRGFGWRGGCQGLMARRLAPTGLLIRNDSCRSKLARDERCPGIN